MRKKIIPLLLCLVLATTLLSACSSPQPDAPPIALSIVLHRHPGANDFTDDMLNEIMPWVRRAVYGGYISIIIGDGDPQVIKIFNLEDFPTNARSRQYMDNLITQRTTEVLNFLRDPNVRGIVDEVDVLGGIVQAERSLNAADARGLERKIIVLGGNGIPTTGFFSLQEFRLEENSAENGYIDTFVSSLTARRGIIPPLENVRISMISLGNVAHPQRLPSTIGVQLEELWRAILRESGATFEDKDIRITAIGGEPIVFNEDDGGPFVSTVFFDTPIVLPPTPPIVIDEDGEAVPEYVPIFNILSDQVAFVPDQAIFRNENNARVVLQEYANWLVDYFEAFPNSYVYVAGFHARLTQEGGNRLNTGLSERRAEAVRSVLIEFNPLLEGHLIAVGLGINGGTDFRVDEFQNGVFCNTQAQLNRKTMLIPAESEYAPLLREVIVELDALR
jgi:outer membrane protein OmpA-like peptidoglycan-associated protein